MKTPHLISAALILTIVVLFSGQVRAEEANIQFPVEELGGCKSKEACKVYCDEPGHMEACIAFAEKNNLMPADEIAKAKKFIAAGKKGPGGCTGRDSCEAYCNDPSNIEACVDFAEKHGLMDGAELAEAQKVRAAIKSGVKPPPCGGKDKCRDYCEQPENMPACIEFAKAAGLMSEEEQKNAEQMLTAIKNGAKPPPCKGREACEAYCADDAHIDECVEFGRAAGFMSAEEAEMARKTRGKGPGGCRGKEACDAFCSQPENESQCMEFAKQHGLISPERLKEMEEGDTRFRGSFGNVPAEVEQCLKSKWGEERYEKLKSGSIRPNESLGAAMRECFESYNPDRGKDPSRGDGPPPSEEGRAFSGEWPPVLPEGHEGRMPPEGVMPMSPDRPLPPEFDAQRQEQYQEQYRQQYQEQFNEQYRQQYQEQYRQQYEQYQQGTPAPTYTEPAPGTAPAPTSESAPHPSPEPTSAELLSAAAILFLKALGF